MGNKIRYHINGTKLDFLGKKALAEYLGCSVANINNAEKGGVQKRATCRFGLNHSELNELKE